MFSEELRLSSLQQSALSCLDIQSLTPMQEAMLFACREPGDVVLLSPTGSGKTVAYLLPLLEREPSDEVQTLVVVPSRELALQTVEVLKTMRVPHRAMAVYGGRPAMDEHRTLRGVLPTLVVGTPGRLVDHLQKGNIAADTVTTLVIDEFDKCLELGFHDEMRTLVELLPKVQRRRLLSATDAAELPEFTGLSRVVKLDYLTVPTSESDRVSTFVVHSPEKDKLQTLYRLLCTLGGEGCMVFCNYRESVERVGKYLGEQRVAHTVYHGGLEQEQRERALYRFRNGSGGVLVTTDLAARGLDIPEVRHIVHYHLPANEEACIHRVGRTARWDADGSTWFLLGPEETLPEYVTAEDSELPDKVGRPAQPEWETIYVGKGKKDKVNRVDIAGFFYKKGGLTKDDVGRIDVMDHYAFVAIRRSKVKSLLTLVVGEKIKGTKTIVQVAR